MTHACPINYLRIPRVSLIYMFSRMSCFDELICLAPEVLYQGCGCQTDIMLICFNKTNQKVIYTLFYFAELKPFRQEGSTAPLEPSLWVEQPFGLDTQIWDNPCFLQTSLPTTILSQPSNIGYQTTILTQYKFCFIIAVFPRGRVSDVTFEFFLYI